MSNELLKVNIQKKLKEFDLNVDFELKKGCLGILGPSGCGKSMTLKSVAGIVNPDNGVISLTTNDETVYYDSNEKINLNNMYWLNFKLVDIVSNVIEIFKFANKIQNFNISTYIIYDVIIGNLSKPVEVFRFNTLPFFGFINSKYNKDVWKLIFAMLDCGIIEIINQERNYISLSSENLKKEDYFHLYSILMEKKKK